MNYKLEKFWNHKMLFLYSVLSFMNYKLEKFWNVLMVQIGIIFTLWTINLKSFEIIESGNNLDEVINEL